MSAHPPREERGEDRYIWRPSSDGRFSVNSAYHFLFAGIHRSAEPIWRAIWRWHVPEKIKTLMWTFAHGRSHTQQLRFTRGIGQSDRYPFGCPHAENPMHLIRDCVNAKERWKALLAQEHWDRFFSLEGPDWLTWNLKKEAGKDYTKRVAWPTLFGY